MTYNNLDDLATKIKERDTKIVEDMVESMILDILIEDNTFIDYSKIEIMEQEKEKKEEV